MPTLAAAFSLFLAHPAPLDMPRAEAYLVNDGESIRLEDRYSVDDLWTSRAVLGRWEDDDGRFFTLSRLDVVPPKFAEAPVTRTGYTKDEALLDVKDDLGLRDQAVARLSPVSVAAEPESPRQAVRGFKEVLYFEGTNKNAVVCAFLREHGCAWRLAVWELLDGDDHDWARELFEREILGNWDELVASDLRSEAFEEQVVKDNGKRRGDAATLSQAALAVKGLDGPARERALLRFDARSSVTNYPSWRVTESAEFSVLDDLGDNGSLVSAVTHELSRMRRRYAEVMPSPIDGSNVLAVARIFADRADYLAAAGDGMEWSAAYWSPLRRELVACLPEFSSRPEDDLLRTLRHEAFHQYFSYASSMLQPSPWINEGYAQYFEDEESLDWQLPAAPGTEQLERWAKALPAVFGMDYEQFYDGDSEARHVKYRLAWSIAVFLEKGAPSVRFQPFKNLKRDYLAALLKTRDMREATIAAFGSAENLANFVAEWKKFWTP